MYLQTLPFQICNVFVQVLRIWIILESWIQIRMKAESWIRIRIKGEKQDADPHQSERSKP
jgi:hypothetical protein